MLEIAEFHTSYSDAVADLILSIQHDEFGIPITLADQPDLLDITGFYQSRGGQFWIALDEGKVVGTVGLLNIGKQQCALRKMFVAPSRRGSQHRTAQRLLDRLAAWSREEGMQHVYLGTTERFHAAHRFYEKNGFVEIGKAALPASFPVMTVDTKFYQKNL